MRTSPRLGRQRDVVLVIADEVAQQLGDVEPSSGRVHVPAWVLAPFRHSRKMSIAALNFNISDELSANRLAVIGECVKLISVELDRFSALEVKDPLSLLNFKLLRVLVLCGAAH